MQCASHMLLFFSCLGKSGVQPHHFTVHKIQAGKKETFKLRFSMANVGSSRGNDEECRQGCRRAVARAKLVFPNQHH